MASAQQEQNGTWTGRARTQGLSESKSGYDSKKKALEWASKRERQYRKARGERGLGPNRTVVADALLQNALETLPFKKGAVQEANRLNAVLRLVGRPTIVATPCPAPEGANDEETFEKRKAQIKFFEVRAQREVTARKVAPSLRRHRAKQEAMSTQSRKVLKRLALMNVGEVTAADLSELWRVRANEGKGASTVRHDVHIFRSMINRVRTEWNWHSLEPIRADDLTLPALPKGRTVVCTPNQEELLAAAMATSYQPKALPATAMLIETAMRFTECMDTARWCDIIWGERLIRLSNAKAGARDVPLNQNALAVLQSMAPGEPHEPIFGFTYEAYKKIFERACKRAGITGLKVHDLRHTAATRGAKRLNGNIFLLQVLTGHKTLTQLQRYVHVNAGDVVQAFDDTAAMAPAGAMAAAAAAAAAVEAERQSEPAKTLRSRAQHEGAKRRVANGSPAWPGRPAASARAIAPAPGAEPATGSSNAQCVEVGAPEAQPACPTQAPRGATVISLAERRQRARSQRR